jgi:outer membrane protein OmpA-like peptidoglycan-associated protein
MRLFKVLVVWVIIVALAAAAYRFIVSPMLTERGDLAEQTQAYVELEDLARQRGLNPEPIPEGADAKTIAGMIRELELRMTGVKVGGSGQQLTIRLSLDAFSGYWVFRSESFREELSLRGIDLELVDDRADYGERMEALRTGEAPMAVFTLDALIKATARLDEAPVTAVMVIDETTGADAMVAYESAVPNIDALNAPDARIVATPDSPSQTLAQVVMANFRLDRLPAAPWVRADGAADVLKRFEKADRGAKAAYVLWEPYVSKALEEDGAHVLIDSSRFRGYIVDVLVVSREFLLDHEDAVRSVVEAYLRTLYDQRRATGGLAAAVRADARQSGEPLTQSQADGLVKGVWWKTTQENYAHMGVGGGSGGSLQTLDEVIRNIASVLLKTDAIGSASLASNPSVLYYDGILRAMRDADFHPSVVRRPGDEDAGQSRAVVVEALSDAQWEQLRPVGTLRVRPIVFARGTAILTRQSKFELDRLAGSLRTWPHYYVSIRGSARVEGEAEANRALAMSRAQAAAAYLTEQGIAAERVRAIGTEPAAEGGRAQTVRFILGQTPY